MHVVTAPTVQATSIGLHVAPGDIAIAVSGSHVLCRCPLVSPRYGYVTAPMHLLYYSMPPAVVTELIMSR